MGDLIARPGSAHLASLQALRVAALHSSHHLCVGHHLGVAPHITIKGHVLYEAHVDRLAARQLHKIADLIVIDAPHYHHVHLLPPDLETSQTLPTYSSMSPKSA